MSLSTVVFVWQEGQWDLAIGRDIDVMAQVPRISPVNIISIWMRTVVEEALDRGLGVEELYQVIGAPPKEFLNTLPDTMYSTEVVF